MACDKVRIRFRKAGDLRLVSHHDLMRCFERMLRRAELPFRSSEGFNPHPRLVFALSLPLGIVGSDEVAELELDAELPPEEVHERLARQAPVGLEILSVRRIDRKTRARVTGVSYRVPLSDNQVGEATEKVNRLLAATEAWVERTRPQPRRINVRAYLRDLRVHGRCSIPGLSLEMDLWVTPTGMARPDEVLAVLGLGDPTETGTVVERFRLEIEDELSPSEDSHFAPGAGAAAPAARSQVADQTREQGSSVGSPVPLFDPPQPAGTAAREEGNP